jgi:hypothetical protein
MKVTRKQKEEIIKIAIKLQPDFLCHTLSYGIQQVLKVDCPSDPIAIQKYIPEFRRSVAIKHFSATRSVVWWDTSPYDERGTADSRNRLRFLRYLLTGKLPKKPIKRK